MGIDSNIYAQFQPKQLTLADMIRQGQEIQQGQQQLRIGNMDLEQKRLGIQNQMRLSDLYQQGKGAEDPDMIRATDAADPLHAGDRAYARARSEEQRALAAKNMQQAMLGVAKDTREHIQQSGLRAGAAARAALASPDPSTYGPALAQILQDTMADMQPRAADDERTAQMKAHGLQRQAQTLQALPSMTPEQQRATLMQIHQAAFTIEDWKALDRQSLDREEKAQANARLDKAQASTEAHQRVMEQQGWGHLALAKENAVSGRGTIYEGPSGPVLVDPRTGQARPIIGADQKPIAAKSSHVAAKVSPEKLEAILTEAEKLVDVAPGSYAGGAVGFGKRLVGVSDEKTQAQSQLQALQAGLMMAMPRMEGPQSDRDVALYREQAGRIGDPTVPAGDKKAALKMIRTINQRYAGGASAPTPAPAPKPNLPKIGTVENGYKYKGGDPGKPSSWDKVQ